MEKVSVIIPTWNRERTLEIAVKSALNQTHPVLEVLVCDDGSDDNSKEVINGINDSRIKWLDCGRNGRPAIPRNIGIQHSKGDWLAFLDSDDSWLPGKNEAQLKSLRENKTWAASTNAFMVIGLESKGGYHTIDSDTLTLKKLIQTNHVICSSAIVHRSIFEKVGGFPEEIEMKALEDYGLWLRVSTQTNFSYLNDLLIRYSDMPGESIRAEITEGQIQRRIVFTNFLNWVKTKKIEIDKETESLCNTIIKNSFSNMADWYFYKAKSVISGKY